MADIADAAPVIAAFEAGQDEDIKIRVMLPTCETALGKQVFVRTDQTPPFDQNVLGVVGLIEMKTW